MTDLAKTIAPKSDQLNADDLIAGPRTITITGVRGCDEPDQPIAIHFEGDDRKPYKPCKSMRRVMVHCWGADGNTYVGKRMSLFCDPNVQFGGIKVGGIRISHMSHIDREMVLPLTVTRAKRSPYTVRPLRAEVRSGPKAARDDGDRSASREADEPRGAGGFPGDRSEKSAAIAWATGIKEDLDAGVFDTVASLDEFTSDPANGTKFGALEAEDPEFARRLNAMIRGRRKALVDREQAE